MAGQVQNIPLARLVPWDNGGKGQPRKHFDQAALEQLADSIRGAGFIGSIVVRPIAGRQGYFEILGGHRRTRAAELAGLREVPATVKDLSDQQARLFVLLDNLNREDFLPWEEGEGYRELEAGGMTRAEVAAQAGRTVPFVAARVRLAEDLCELARQDYLAGAYGVGVLDILAALPNRVLSPVRCPRCKVVLAEGTQDCSACGQDLRGEWEVPAGNPQEVAARACRGSSTEAAAEQIEQVKAAYGLAAAPVQTSLGFDDVQLSQEAIQARTELERRLEKIGRLDRWLEDHAAALREYTPDQRQAVAAQVAAAVRVLQNVAAAVGAGA